MEEDEENLSVCHQHSDLLFLTQEMINVLPQQNIGNQPRQYQQQPPPQGPHEQPQIPPSGSNEDLMKHN